MNLFCEAAKFSLLKKYFEDSTEKTGCCQSKTISPLFFLTQLNRLLAAV